MEVTLDQKAAYLLRKPIRTPDEMPRPIETRPIDDERQKWIDHQWWTHKKDQHNLCKIDRERINPDLFILRDMLLMFGGSEVCLPVYEEDLEKILNRGQLWYGDRIHKMRGKPSQCHRNSAYCWEANQDKTVLCTGYALSMDGVWRQHSWLVEIRPRRNRIVETTVERVAYFGFAMDTDESWQFYFDNE